MGNDRWASRSCGADRAVRDQERAAHDPRTRAYLRDYTSVLDSVPFPSLLVDHRWNVAVTNSAYDLLFDGFKPHPTAMPHQNFLRLVLFHPDAGRVLRERETSWCLPMLAQFAAALDVHRQDPVLKEIRNEIGQNPIMNAAFQQGLPHWVRAVGPGAVDHDGAVRPVQHPDPRWGRTTCRVVTETPSTLRAAGLTRLTLALHPRGSTPAAEPEPVPDSAAPAPEHRGAPRLRVVRDIPDRDE
ncbi:hypothetical protein DSC45_11030 [Streptomyces sp. YIM 130001]|uniref:MmyB family transcriptional regulator n=1 Tax=Streptomyces sp. YIM 130001 TaxID=2259644 RepID=UPI000E6573CE|nr:hypothetical protein [Streptomyces sp. YIM 130001]RII18441.1 hypothetical protein DSC45_11030 [Streptomyces sp. YIM 130001]